MKGKSAKMPKGTHKMSGGTMMSDKEMKKMMGSSKPKAKKRY